MGIPGAGCLEDVCGCVGVKSVWVAAVTCLQVLIPLLLQPRTRQTFGDASHCAAKPSSRSAV